MYSLEQRHIVVCHQLRYQLRKQTRHLQNHGKGLHKTHNNGCPHCFLIKESVKNAK